MKAVSSKMKPIWDIMEINAIGNQKAFINSTE